jgi:hypothetical protein
MNPGSLFSYSICQILQDHLPYTVTV